MFQRFSVRSEEGVSCKGLGPDVSDSAVDADKTEFMRRGAPEGSEIGVIYTDAVGSHSESQSLYRIAPIECRVFFRTDAIKRDRNDEIGQFAALVERVASQGHHCIRDLKGNYVQFTERIRPYALNAVFKHDLFQSVPALVPGCELIPAVASFVSGIIESDPGTGGECDLLNSGRTAECGMFVAVYRIGTYRKGQIPHCTVAECVPAERPDRIRKDHSIRSTVIEHEVPDKGHSIFHKDAFEICCRIPRKDLTCIIIEVTTCSVTFGYGHLFK